MEKDFSFNKAINEFNTAYLFVLILNILFSIGGAIAFFATGIWIAGFICCIDFLLGSVIIVLFKWAWKALCFAILEIGE